MRKDENVKVFVIDPDQRSVTVTDIDDGATGIARLIGFDSIDFDDIDDNGDRLYFDESCFIRHGSETGRFKVDNLAPVAGKGVIAGSAPGGGLRDAVVSADALERRVRFL